MCSRICKGRWLKIKNKTADGGGYACMVDAFGSVCILKTRPPPQFNFVLFYPTPFKLYKCLINPTSLPGTQRMCYFIYYVLCNSPKC